MEWTGALAWGEVVTILRTLCGWSQRKLADAAGVSASAVCRYEDGSRPAPIDLLLGAMGFPLHVAESTLAFVRWIRAVRAPGLAAADGGDALVGELGHWLESLIREGFTHVLAESSDAELTEPAVPRWWADKHVGLVEPLSLHLGQAVTVLRILSGWNRAELAAAAGIPERALENLEQSKNPRNTEALNRIVEKMGFSRAGLSRTIHFIMSARLARELKLAHGDRLLQLQALAVAARESQELEHFARGSTARLAISARLLDSRRQARELWERLRSYPNAAQLDLVREAAKFQTAGFAELLCEESRAAAGDSAARAAHLATCAVAAAAAVPGGEAWRQRLEGYCRFHLANADRVSGNLAGADQEFGRSQLLWSAGAGADPGLLNEARVLHLEAALRREQRRLPEALALIEGALEIDRWGETPGLLMSKAKALEELGQYKDAIVLLQGVDAQLVKKDTASRTLFVLRAQLLVNLCHLGHHAAAEVGFSEVRALAHQLGNHLDALRVKWLRGKIAAGLGRTGEAINILAEVRAEFNALGNAYDTALVTLELAYVHASIGRTAAVKALARESAPTFEEQGVHREARQALTLFCQAAENERASAELMHGILNYLYRSRYNSRVRYEGAF